MTMTCTESTIDLILAEEMHLRGVARRLAQCESDVDDLVQDTLLRAYCARDRFRSGSSVRAWTTTILRRVFLTGAIRTKRRRLQTDTDAGGALEAVIGREPTPLDDAADHAAALGECLEDPVKRALDRVPEVYRTAFLLLVVRDLSCQEIGQELRVPVGTVTSRVHRAREHLRNELRSHRNTAADERGAAARRTRLGTRTHVGFGPMAAHSAGA